MMCVYATLPVGSTARRHPPRAEERPLRKHGIDRPHQRKVVGHSPAPEADRRPDRVIPTSRIVPGRERRMLTVDQGRPGGPEAPSSKPFGENRSRLLAVQF
jgi:hypothetical protein